jgi:hypothetical protein
MADSTLNAIRIKVRRLTKSPSEAQLTTAQLDEYVNTFVQYDFPEHLRTFALRKQFTFYTRPFIEEYSTSVFTTDPMFNFKNRKVNIFGPVYAAGFQIFLSQSPEQFNNIYPILNSVLSTGLSGNGITTFFQGRLTQGPVLANNVTFTAATASGVSPTQIIGATTRRDVPVVDSTTFLPTTVGNLYEPDNIPATPPTVINPFNFINYVTGDFKVTFSTAPAAGAAITAETVFYNPALPQAMLFFDNKFRLRPVPDRAYPIQMEVDVRPVELLQSGQSPDLEQWWQYIAYGASKKIFEDRMDLESVQLIMPEYRKQENLVNRTTIVNQTKERVATIYTEQTDLTSGTGYTGGAFGVF